MREYIESPKVLFELLKKFLTNEVGHFSGDDKISVGTG